MDRIRLDPRTPFVSMKLSEDKDERRRRKCQAGRERPCNLIPLLFVFIHSLPRQIMLELVEGGGGRRDDEWMSGGTTTR